MYQTDKCVVAQVFKVVVIINLIIIDHSRMTQAFIDRVSVPSHIAVDIFDGMQWRGTELTSTCFLCKF